MVIQHNVPALNSHRNLGMNNVGTAKNLEKLSSGFRVNRAGDDAAGLAISEKMRGQIRGLAMAEKNTSNGVSLIQTAEGGMNEIHSILHRMRELAVQSSNGTYQDDDRNQIQVEFQALKYEIDRISSSVHYNSINLLDGTTGGSKVKSLSGGDWGVGTNGALTEKMRELGFGVDIQGTQTAGHLLFMVHNTPAADALKGQTATFIVTDSSQTEDGEVRLTLQVGGKDYVGFFADESIGGALPERYYFVDEEGTVVADLCNSSDNLLTHSRVQPGFASGVISGIQIRDTYGQQMWLMDGRTASDALADSHEFLNATIATTKDRLFLQIGANGGSDQRLGFYIRNMSTGNLGAYDAVTHDGPSGVLPAGTQYTVRNGSVASAFIHNREEANAAISTLDGAINQVSAERAALGAIQNRLEHTLNNLGVTKENLTAAESTIRDVDMAKEMMDYTKNSILVQASQSMLAQANQFPQGILSLLR